MSRILNGKITKLDQGERWMADGLRSCVRAAGFLTVDVDMSAVANYRARHRRVGVCITYTHVLVRAVALAFTRLPKLKELILGDRRWKPERVNISVSVAGREFLAPVVIISDAEQNNLAAIADEFREGTLKARMEQKDMLKQTRRWGWMVPFGFMRRAILRRLMHKVFFGAPTTPTFHISCVPDANQMVSMVLGTSTTLCAGGVTDRVIAVKGKPEVRPMMTLNFSGDHLAWSGIQGNAFVREVKAILESGDCLDPDPQWASSERAREPALIE